MKDERTKFGSISSSLSFFHPSKLIKDRRCEGHRFDLFLSLSLFLHFALDPQPVFECERVFGTYGHREHNEFQRALFS